MKVKRILFISALMVLFIACLWKMNEHYDELARYPHTLSEEQRELVLEHLSTEEINYLVTQKISPNQFLPYIEEDNFQINNTLWYHTAYQTRKESKSYIVSFINKYKEHMDYAELYSVLQTYSYNVLTRFFDEGDSYVSDARLVADPTSMFALIDKDRTLYTYEPSDLVSINDLPHASLISKNDITLRKKAVKPLKELCTAAKEINSKTCGDMTIVAGYISNENQISLYEAALKKYTKDIDQYSNVPGQSEYQLGYTIQLKPNTVSTKSTTTTTQDKTTNKTATKPLSEEEQEQAIWLKDNSYKYGFILRYPKQKEDVTGKRYQPYTLRYVGKELAKYMHDNNLALEEVDLKDYKE